MVRTCLRRALVAAVFGGLLFAVNPPRQPAPKFVATTLRGEKLTNESLKGKVVLLQFWATWCSFCRGDQPAVDALVRDFAGKGLVVLAVDVGESRSKVEAYLRDSPRACHIVLAEDTNLASIFAPTSFPLYVLIDKDGNLAAAQRGAGGESALRRLLQEAGLEAYWAAVRPRGVRLSQAAE
jgi:thiol-disulfide isomerase/thioredoxin